MFKKSALCVGAVLTLIAILLVVIRTQQSPRYEPFPGEGTDLTKPYVRVSHPNGRDFAFHTGSLIPAVVELRLPQGWRLESDMSLDGDLRLISRKVRDVKHQTDGTWYVLDIQVQAIDYKQEWMSLLTLTVRDAQEKVLALRRSGVVVYGSRTYDGRIEKYGKDPYTEPLTHDWLPTLLWLLPGLLGTVACIRLLLQRQPRVPKPKPTAVVPVDPFDAVDRQFRAVDDDPTDALALRALDRAIREFYGIRHLTVSELEARGQALDKQCAVVLRICEEKGVWQSQRLSTKEWLTLWEMHAVLLAAHRKAQADETAKKNKARRWWRRRWRA